MDEENCSEASRYYVKDENEVGVYNKAIECFNNASDLLDASEKAEQLKTEAVQYNGTYEYVDDIGVIRYIFVKDGTVASEISSKYSYSGMYNLGEATEYRNLLIKSVLEPEAIEKLGGTVTEETIKTLVIGSAYNDTSSIDKEYLFMDVSGGQKFVANLGTFNTLNGLYSKIDTNTPPAAK